MMRLRTTLVLVLLGLLVLSCNATERQKSLRAKINVENADESRISLPNMNANNGALVEEDSEPRRHLINFWALVIQLIHHPCLPHQRHKGECGDHSSSSSSGGGGNGGGNGGKSDYSGGSEGGDGVSAATGDSSATSDTSSSGIAGTNLAKSSIWLLAVAAAAATAALIAAVVGQRKNRQDRHSLAGSVSRRMSLMTNACGPDMLCGDRPERMYEMKNARDYQRA